MERDQQLGILGIIIGTLLTYLIDNIKINYSLIYNFIDYLIYPLFIISLILFLNLHNRIIDEYYKLTRWNYPVKVAVYNGLINNSKPKKRCEKTNFNDDSWKTHLESIIIDTKKKFKVDKISVSQISNKYTIIINPFGEIHLDENNRTLNTLYNNILNFIKEGGIYVCTGGIPFYYIWDEILGILVDTTQLTVELDQGKVNQFRVWDNTIFTNIFGLRFNGDKSTPAEVFQNDSDKEYFGDLDMIGGSNTIIEFRSAIDKNIILPALRTHFPHIDREGKISRAEVYPLYVLPYDKGYLMVAGMSLDQVGFNKMVSALSTFTNYIKKSKKLT